MNNKDNLKLISNEKNTLLMILCEKTRGYPFKSTILELLTLGPSCCNLKQVNDNGYTALMIACHNKMTDVALKILEYGPEECNLKHVSYNVYNGYTTLMIACHNKMTDVALKILEYGPEECNLNYKASDKFNALYYAKQKKLKSVINKIKEYNSEENNSCKIV